MKTILFIAAICASLAGSPLQAQDLFYTKTGTINFLGSTALETIDATNRKVTSIMNTKTGEIEFSALIMAFQFEKALMQEHFNENYMESAKYPKATFKGKILNLDQINFAADGTYPAKVAGKLTIHGVTRDVTTDGTFTVKNGSIQAMSDFMVVPQDYNIQIPALVKDKIAKQIKVSVANTYEPYQK